MAINCCALNGRSKAEAFTARSICIFSIQLSYELKKLTEKNTLCKKHSATDMWWVTSKAQNGEIRIVPILEILRKPIGTAVGQDSRYNIRYSQEPVKAIGFKALMKKYK